MRGAAVLAVIAGSLLQPAAAQALAVQSIDASLREGVYRITLVVRIDAPMDAVSAVLTDYAAYRSLDPRIRSSTILPPDHAGSELVRTIVRACAGLFCRNIVRVERVQKNPGELLAVVVPEQSDLRSGQTRTTWHAEDQATSVTYEAEFVPDFWVPVAIGRRYAVPALKESTLQLFDNVEKRALER